MSPTTVETRPEAEPGLLGGRYRALTVGAVALISLSAFEALAVATAMPTVTAALDGLSLYAPAFGGPFAAGVVGLVLAGGWSDRSGPAAPLWAGIALFAAGLLAAGSAAAMPLLVLGRVVQGLGSGLLIVALYVVVARVYPARLHPRIFAAFAGAWVIPAIVGPGIAGLIVERFGWRWVFLTVPLLAVPAALIMRPGLRDLPAQAAVPAQAVLPAQAAFGRRLGWAVGAAVSAGLLHYGGQQTGAHRIALLAVGLTGLALCAPPLLPAGLLRARRGMPTVVVLRGLAGAAFAGAEVFIPLLLSRERGLSPTAAGFALTIGAVSWSAGSWFQGRPRQPLSRTGLLRTGMALMAAGIGCVALTVSPAVPVPVGVVGWGAAGLGMGLIFPTLSVLTLQLSTPAEQGSNSSALQLGDSLAAAVILALVGAILAAAGPGPVTYLLGFAVCVSLVVLGGLITGRVNPARPSAPRR